jgi:predicted amidohydrolase YtcJ
MSGTALVIRNAEIEARGVADILIVEDRIISVGSAPKGFDGPEVDARGAAVIPGLWDHHLHLFATAAKRASLDVDPGIVRNADMLRTALARASAQLPPGDWLRIVGYHESIAGPLDRWRLDAILPDRPVRLQYRTGSLWVLNSAGVAMLGTGPFARGVELDHHGQITGRIFREDAWLRTRIAASPPSLAAVAADLTAAGIVGVTDASATNDNAAALVLGQAIARAGMAQRLWMMGKIGLRPPAPAVTVGPLKIILDEYELAHFEEVIDRIRRARKEGRAVAFHCVTAAELAMALATLEAAGVERGDRVEHGGVISPWAADRMAELGLTVVTQPIFIAERGDQYRNDVDPVDLPDLYRCATLLERGIRLAASSDAPYGQLDPWAGMRSAVSRSTRSGHILGASERISPRQALGMWLGAPEDPGGAERRLEPGELADLCVLHAGLGESLRVLKAEVVRMTIIGGRIVHGT